jgi:hypothetical protein
MASITSVISLFVLLLVTYCYAVPIGQGYDISTPKYEFTSGKTMVGRETKMNMDFKTDDESTDEPHMHKERKTAERDSDEYTTSSHMGKRDDESDLKRTFEDSLFTTSDYESHHDRSVEDLYETTSATDLLSEKPHHLRSFDDYLFTTMESSVKFNERAVKLREGESGEHAQPEKELEMTTSFESSSSPVEPESYTYKPTSSSTVEHESHTFEPSSSVDSFGKSTGFLHKDESEEKLTTPEYKTVRPIGQPSTRFPVDGQRLTQTETIIPGKITETKIFANAGSRTYIVSEPIPVKQSQLNQGRTWPILEKEKSDN